MSLSSSTNLEMEAKAFLLLLVIFRGCEAAAENCLDNATDLVSFCLPSDYVMTEMPRLPEAERPLRVRLRFYTREVVEIEDNEHAITLATYFKLEWPEPRLVLNPASSMWRTDPKGAVFSTLASSWVDRLWVPDIEFHGLHEFKMVSSVKSNGALKIYNRTKDGREKIVSLMVFAHITVACTMR